MGLTATGFSIDSFSIQAPVFSTIGLGSYDFTLGDLDCTFSLGFSARGGVGGNPTTPQQWSVGIVQNVVFESIVLNYGSKEFSVQFPGTVLDTAADVYTPFYADPDLGNGMDQTVEDIWLTSKGYDRVVDPPGIRSTPSSAHIASIPA